MESLELIFRARRRASIKRAKRILTFRQTMPFGSLPSSSSACEMCGCNETSCEGCDIPNECNDPESCCCSDAHRSWRLGRMRAGVSTEYLSTAWMGIEVIGSILGGLAAGSLALLAFGGDSVIELISGIAVLRFLRGAVNHGGIASESEMTERVTSLLLFALIPVIGAGSLYSYYTGIRAEGSPLGIAVCVGALIVIPYLWYQKRAIGRETRTLPLSFDAVESVTCIFMAVALLGGLLAEYLLGLWWADYAATALILAFVAREAVEFYHELHHG
jgi:divalent metal cation (Fe/Co/Zn/Cd) transporter